MVKKAPRKQQIGRSPAETAEHKKSFVEALTKGFSPGVAARMAGISRRTAFYWKNEDKEFAELWSDAVETGLDELESAVFQRGLLEGGEDARSQLKYRRYAGMEAAARAPREQTNFILNVTMEEHFKRLTLMGVPLPEIESDYEDLDAPTRK